MTKTKRMNLRTEKRIPKSLKFFDQMRHIRLVLIVMVTFSALGFHSFTSADAKRNDRHRFAGLRLKGELKKPDLSYIYKRKGLREEKILKIPENFNDEIIRGTTHL